MDRALVDSSAVVSVGSDAPSIGQFVNTEVKGKFRYKKLELAKSLSSASGGDFPCDSVGFSFCDAFDGRSVQS